MDFFLFEEYILLCFNTKWTCIVSKFSDKKWTLNKSLFIGLQDEGYCYNKDLLGMKRQRTATGFPESKLGPPSLIAPHSCELYMTVLAIEW